MRQLIHRVRFWRDHRWTPPHMSAYLDEDLAPNARVRFDRHVTECAQCRRLLAGLRATLRALRSVPSASSDSRATRIATSVRARLNDPPGAR
jgi:anti-sigma factor RsiW